MLNLITVVGAGNVGATTAQRLAEKELARRVVGYVPDTLPAHADITVHEYLDFYARAYGLKGKKRTQAVEAIEEFTNVAGIRDKHLKALSKGMKQRVTLGRALVYDPDVLILDEPAAAEARRADAPIPICG